MEPCDNVFCIVTFLARDLVVLMVYSKFRVVLAKKQSAGRLSTHNVVQELYVDSSTAQHILCIWTGLFK